MLSDNGGNTREGSLHGGFSPIHIPATTAIVNTLVDLMLAPAKAEVSTFDIGQTLLTLCDEFDMPLVKHIVVGKLHPFAGQHSIKIFCIASHSDDLTLARQALSRWRPSGEILAWNIESTFYTPEFMRDCEPSYFFGLLRMIVACLQQGNDSSEPHWFCISSSEWVRQLDGFKPVRK
jgi:hypothetical protein